MRTLLGADIGGTKCMVCVGGVSDGGEISIAGKFRFETSADNPEASMARLETELEKLLSETRLPPPAAVGVSVGGYIDTRAGVIVSTPVIPLLKNYPICAKLSARFGVPAFAQNDANACALAEWLYGAGRGSVNMVFLTAGTGLGSGLILDGKLYVGSAFNAGEVGHIRLSPIGPVGCGKAGSFEGLCSGAGMGQYAKMRALEALQSGRAFAFAPNLRAIESLDAKTVSKAANAGDADAIAIFEQVGENFGRGLAVIVDILNPDTIVIGSVFQRDEKLLRPAITRALYAEAQPVSARSCKIVPALLGDDIGLYAAFATAMNGLNNQTK